MTYESYEQFCEVNKNAYLMGMRRAMSKINEACWVLGGIELVADGDGNECEREVRNWDAAISTDLEPERYILRQTCRLLYGAASI